MYRRIFDELKEEHARRWLAVTPESFGSELEMMREREKAMESMIRLVNLQTEKGETPVTQVIEQAVDRMSEPIEIQESPPDTPPVEAVEQAEPPAMEEPSEREPLKVEEPELEIVPAALAEEPVFEEAVDEFLPDGVGEDEEEDEEEETIAGVKKKKNRRKKKKKEEETADEFPKEPGVSYDKMERKIRGGYLQKVKTYIPEMVVRQNDFEHGDIIRASETGDTLENGEPRYHFELYEKGNAGPLKSRWEFNRCVIEEAAGRLYIRKTADDGNIRVNGMPFSMFVNDDDAEEFSLKPGDVVDAACQKDKAETARVIWKYATTVTEELVAEPEQAQAEGSEGKPASPVKPIKPAKSLKPKKKLAAKKVEQKENKEEEEKVEKLLKGRTVAIVADEHYKAGYKEAVEKLGGRLVMIDGHYTKPRILNAVKKADVVVAVVTGTSHHAAGYSKKFAKTLDKPWTFSENKGAMGCAKLAASTLLLHEEFKTGKALPVLR